MATREQELLYRKRKNQFYWLAYLFSYILPFTYFAVKLGLTQEVTKIVMPTVIVGLLGILRLSSDIPRWVSTWEPSFAKGLVKGIPKIILFVILITLGLTLKYVMERTFTLGFEAYFETVIVLFGGSAVGAIFEAYHLKYKELYLLAKGYVLGVVNK